MAPSSANTCCRSPFSDSLVASGSDDGKVRARRHANLEAHAHEHRLLYGKSLRASRREWRKGKNPKM